MSLHTTLIPGDNFGIPFTSAKTLREEERSYPSLAFLAPSRRLWTNDEVIVQTDRKNYTVFDYEDLFHDLRRHG